MKKFMFTAIAMVAFMGSSMANTIELQEVKVNENTLEHQISEDLKGDKTNPADCKKLRNFTASVLLNAGESEGTANYFANFVYDACMQILVN